MIYSLSILIFLLPVIGMLSGFSASWIIMIFTLLLYLSSREIIKINLQNIILPLSFCSWIFISCLWGENYLISLRQTLIISSSIVIGVIIIDNIGLIRDKLQTKNISLLKHFLAYGLIGACLIFFIEKYTDGIITTSFSAIFSKEPKQFFLYSLDRGCTILSVTTWIIICNFLRNKFYILAVILYSIVLTVLLLSDSTASLLAYLVTSIVLIFSYVGQNFFYRIYRILFLVFIIILPILIYFLPVDHLVDNELASIPLSAKHRLFIWHFIVHKILDSPLIGYGIGASKVISQLHNESVLYHNQILELFPLHPHNSVLQLYLELGVIGVIMALYTVDKYLRKVCAIVNSTDRYFTLSVYLCFTNYITISMISYSLWQSWWICFASFTLLIVNLFR